MRLRRSLIALATGSMLAAAGCTHTEYVQTPLPRPPRPNVPTLSGDQLQCLSDDAYKAIVNRDRAKTEHIERLESVIESTHGD